MKMRTTTWAAWVLSGWTLGCGGFDNQSLLASGAIRGRIADADAAIAEVWVAQDTSIRARVDETGAFVLNDVPAGTVDLWWVASSENIGRWPAEVRPASMTDVGTLSTGKGGYIEVFGKDVGDLPAGSRVTLTGTPYAGREVGSNGRATIGPLPAGCYGGEATLPGGAVARSRDPACVAAGQSGPSYLEFRVDDHSENHP